ncbi:MAG: hypothetical protein ACFN0J_10650 [Segatella salivae]
MKVRMLLIALFAFISFQMSAQTNDEVTLVVSADGATKEEATANALRSAIEQAYGTFVSANTTLANDELVKDDIVTITNGNIKNYKEISNETLPNDNIFVTLQATVSIPQLISYAKSKGARTEFAGATFAMNLKMEQLNKYNEEKAVDNMFKAMEKLYLHGFNYKISVSNPKANGQLTANVEIVANRNAVNAEQLFYRILKSISLNKQKAKEYEDLGKPTYSISFWKVASNWLENYFKNAGINYYRTNKYKLTERYVFRSEETVKLFNRFFNYIYPKSILGFHINAGNEKSQIQIVSSCVIENSSYNYGKLNNISFGEETPGKRIFSVSIPAYQSDLYNGSGMTDYYRDYLAKERSLNYIQSIMDIENFCYYSYCEDVLEYNIKDNIGTVVGYPVHKEGKVLHKVLLNMQIPIEDLMKISNFTIASNNE